MKTRNIRLLAVLGSLVSLSSLYGQAGYGYSFTWGEGASAAEYGFAHGYQATAEYSGFAFGEDAFAGYGYDGANVAIGFGALATSIYYTPASSIAIGGYADAAYGSVSLGHDASSNNESLAVGAFSRALMTYSASFGRSAQATGLASLALGYLTYAPAVGGVGIGMGNKARKKDGGAPSTYIASSIDPILMVGNSIYPSSNGVLSDSDRKNALTVYRDGDVHVAGKIRVQPAGDIPMFSTVKPSGVSYP